jgi:hypothetical protein
MKDLDAKTFQNIYGYEYYVRGVRKDKELGKVVDYETVELINGSNIRGTRHTTTYDAFVKRIVNG